MGFCTGFDDGFSDGFSDGFGDGLLVGLRVGLEQCIFGHIFDMYCGIFLHIPFFSQVMHSLAITLSRNFDVYNFVVGFTVGFTTR